MFFKSSIVICYKLTCQDSILEKIEVVEQHASAPSLTAA